jgi:two-component system OmpR family response regulator
MILVVEDHADTCRMLELLLRRAGFDATCVHSGSEALAVLRQMRPEAVILDDMMPGMTGVEVLRTIKADRRAYPGVPIIFYSANAEQGEHAEAMRLGAAAWVTKGVSGWDDLLGMILDALQRRRLDVYGGGTDLC